MNNKKIIFALAAIMMAVVPLSVLVADGSDAYITINDNDVWGQGFTNTKDGTLFVTLRSDEGVSTPITIIVTEGSRELKRTTVTVPAKDNITSEPGKITAELGFRLDSAGTHTLTVTCTPASWFPSPSPGGTPLNTQTVDVTVDKSIWSNTTTYIAIIAAALLIVIAVFLKIRSTPASKPDTTFTELEKQKGEPRAIKEEAPKSSATERRRYRGSDEAPKETKKSSSPPPEPQEEKKAATFTELEKQKSEKKDYEAKKEPQPQPKKDTAPKKETPSEEPKKLKYVSSRRK